jgi:type II secretory pathway component PulJ
MHPVIETQRLILRPPQRGDEIPLNDAINRSLPALQCWMPWAIDPSLAPTMRFVEEALVNWGSDKPRDLPMVVVHKTSQQIIVLVDLMNGVIRKYLCMKLVIG